MDVFRRCQARDKDGHRCKRHLFHLREVPTGINGLELPAEAEGDKHIAFGREF